MIAGEEFLRSKGGQVKTGCIFFCCYLWWLLRSLELLYGCCWSLLVSALIWVWGWNGSSGARCLSHFLQDCWKQSYFFKLLVALEERFKWLQLLVQVAIGVAVWSCIGWAAKGKGVGVAPMDESVVGCCFRSRERFPVVQKCETVLAAAVDFDWLPELVTGFWDGWCCLGWSGWGLWSVIQRVAPQP